MNLVREVYNNETIGAIAIYSILQHLKCISLSKILLIIPFTSHKGTLDFMKSDATNVRSLEEFIVKKPELFSNFSDRYYSFVNLSINSILLLLEMKVAIFNNNMLMLHSQNSLEITEENFGSRAMQISRGALKLSKILIEEEKNLYLQLRVQL
ncbi:three component ABC system middle component [Paenibacillus chitinolyticus]|uniref:three component ABC system middle component n=1 Tax=Paenibacillus chitinolyticus TaxID=79263 RepID=UPI001C471C1E|nr:three component ABC system middle component [Paenibacillus chitinolyticus]MBV6714864.1 hypothetical protein [Paenibacillus chitinolyticus]